MSVVKGSEKIHCQALSLRERVQGQEHPDTLTGMNNLANVLREPHDQARLEVAYRRVTGSLMVNLRRDMSTPDLVSCHSSLACHLSSCATFFLVSLFGCLSSQISRSPPRLVVTYLAPTIFQYYLLELSILGIRAWAVNGSSSAARYMTCKSSLGTTGNKKRRVNPFYRANRDRLYIS